MLYTYHTMAELLALISMVELPSMIVTQTIVLLQTKSCLKKDFKCSRMIVLEQKLNPNKNERYFAPSLNHSYYYHGYERKPRSYKPKIDDILLRIN